MDPFAITAIAVLALSAFIGIACCFAIKRGQVRWPFAALFTLPVLVFLIEALAFPSSLDGVTTLTGIFTIMFCVIWVPYWVVMALLGIWLGPKTSA